MDDKQTRAPDSEKEQDKSDVSGTSESRTSDTVSGGNIADSNAEHTVSGSASVAVQPVAVASSPYKNRLLRGLDKFYGVTKNGSSIKVEIFAGIATFLAMCYILVVNPDTIFFSSQKSDPMWASVFLATAFGAIIGTLLMSLVAKMPYAQAPGMGLNSMVGGLIGGMSAYTGTAGFHLSFGNAMLLVLISGIIFLLLSAVPGGRDKKTGKLISLREVIFDGIPKAIRTAIPVGIGLFIAFLGFQNAGIIVPNTYTLVDLTLFNIYTFKVGEYAARGAIICFIGLLTIGILAHFKVKAAVIIGILAATIVAIPMGDVNFNLIAGKEPGISWAFWENFGRFFNMNPDNGGSFAAAFTEGFNFGDVGVDAGSAVMTCIMTVVAFCMIDMFDTMGTITGCATRAGLVDGEGKPLNFGKCMYADSIATCAGAILGTSTVSTFVESGTGVAAGGKTGLTALSTAIMFFLSIFLLPLFAFIPSSAAACALIYVGVLMMSNVKNIDFGHVKNAIPAFLTIIIMPLGYSITDGIGVGLLSYVLLGLLIYVGELIVNAIKKKPLPKFDIPVVTLIVAALFCVYFFVPTSFGSAEIPSEGGEDGTLSATLSELRV